MPKAGRVLGRTTRYPAIARICAVRQFPDFQWNFGARARLWSRNAATPRNRPHRSVCGGERAAPRVRAWRSGDGPQGLENLNDCRSGEGRAPQAGGAVQTRINDQVEAPASLVNVCLCAAALSALACWPALVTGDVFLFFDSVRVPVGGPRDPRVCRERDPLRGKWRRACGGRWRRDDGRGSRR